MKKFTRFVILLEERTHFLILFLQLKLKIFKWLCGKKLPGLFSLLIFFELVLLCFVVENAWSQ